MAAWPSYAFGFMLVFSRVGAAMILLPGIGESEVPMPVRLALALCMSALIMPTLQLPTIPDNLMPLAIMLGGEMVVGIWLGFMARIVLLALPIAGQMISLLVGMSSVLQPDPSFGGQATALTRLFSLGGITLMFLSGLYVYPLQALGASYTVLGPGATLVMGDMTQTLLMMFSKGFAFAFGLAAPFLVFSVVVQAALGLVTRLVPQIQIFTVAMPGQMLAGLLVLSLLMVSVLQHWRDGARLLFGMLPGGQ